MSEIIPISVIIPTHNDSDQLEKTIQSCLHDRCIDEIIVIDDASDKEHTNKVIGLARAYKCKYMRNQINYGLAGSRNNAINAAKNKWILPVDCGDWIHASGADGLVETAVEDIFLNDVYYGCITNGKDEKTIHKPYPEINKNILLTSPDSPLFCSSLFSKSIWIKSGGYTIREYSFYEDLSYYCKICNVGGTFKFVDVLVYHHAYNPNSMLSKLHAHTDYFKRLARWEFDRKQLFYNI